MANEFVARRGIIIPAGGANITGSTSVVGDITASGDVKATNFRGSGQFLTNIAADSVQWNNVLNKPTVVSSSLQFNTITDPFTGSFTGSFTGDGSQLSGIATTLNIAGSTTGTDAVNLKTETLVFSGSNNITATVTDNTVTIGVSGLVSQSSQVDHDATTNFVANEHIDHSAVSISAGFGLTGGGDITTTRTLSLDTSSATFNDGVKSKLNTEGVLSSSAQVQYGSISGVPNGIVSSSTQVSYTGISNVPSGIVSASSQIDVRNTTGIATIATTGSNTFTSNQIVSGNITLASDGQIRIVDNTDSTLFGFFDGSNILGAYYQMWGNNHASTNQRGSAEFVFDTRNSGGGFRIASFDGATFSSRVEVNSNGTTNITGSLDVNSSVTASAFKGDGSQLTNVAATNVEYANVLNKPTLVSSSGQIDHDLTTGFVANEHVDHSTVSISAGSGLSGGGDITTSRTLTLNTSSAHFTGGVKSKLDADGVISSSAQVQYGSISGVSPGIVSSSGQVSYTGLSNVPVGIVSSSDQVDVRNTTGVATIATTGSNTFTGVQTISNTTNSTNYTDGALIVQGGVGIAKDVNISGSLNVTGLLTVASMSTQYVTSSQYNIGVSRVVVNDDDLLRFAGLSVIDSGSTYGTGSLLWDSLYNRWIYEADDQAYNSAILIAGPKNTGTLGDEVGLVTGRVPVASGDDHIDSRVESSSIRVDFPSRLTSIEAGLYVTGAVSSSVGFWGDGSNLTGVVSTLSVTGSQGGTGTVNLKTQGLTVNGSTGVQATVSGQTVTISGTDASTTAKGVAVFNATNFTVNSGQVTASAITFNGVPLNLGGTYAFGLQNITSTGASTADPVTFSGGATIGASFQTSSTYIAAGPTTNEVVLSLSTGSYDAAHFDYVLKDGSNLRTGTVMSVWSGTSVEFTDTSTNDIGNTLGANFTVDTSGANVRLKFTVSSGTWTIKTTPKFI